MTHRAYVPAEVEIHEKPVFPSLYEEAATMDAGPIRRIGRSATHPFVFYLFGPKDGRESVLIATVNLSNAFEVMARTWEQVAENAKTEEESWS